VEWSVNQKNPEPVTEELKHMITEITEHIKKQQVDSTKEDAAVKDAARSNQDIVKAYKEAEGAFKQLPKSDLKLLGDLPEPSFMTKEDVSFVNTDGVEVFFRRKDTGKLDYYVKGVLMVTDLISLAVKENNITFEGTSAGNGGGSKVTVMPENDEVAQRVMMLYSPPTNKMIQLLEANDWDVSMAKAVNRAFLHIVRSNYWNQIEHNNIRPGTPEAEVLLTSIRIALSPLKPDLEDYKFVTQHLETHMKITDENNTNWWQVFPDDDAAAGAAKSGSSFRENLMKLVNSSIFNGFIAVMIVLNGVYVAIDEIFRNSENQFNAAWLVVEFVFTFTFAAEFF
jgi:hypothetical protein